MWRAVLFLAGVASVVWGVALLSVPLAFIVGGVMVAAGAAALELADARKSLRHNGTRKGAS